MPTMTRQRPLISGLFYFMEEIFKDIPGYEGLYQVSNLGNVKSFNLNKETIMNPGVNSTGYYQVILYKYRKIKGFNVHQLVAMAFLNHIPCGYKLVVDHINDNPLDNRVDNLHIITQRENCKKTQGKYSSKYKGVSWFKQINKWRADIFINGKNNYLGRFDTEEEASQAYQNKLKEII